jgi:hypothetical protein
VIYQFLLHDSAHLVYTTAEATAGASTAMIEEHPKAIDTNILMSSPMHTTDDQRSESDNDAARIAKAVLVARTRVCESCG